MNSSGSKVSSEKKRRKLSIELQSHKDSIISWIHRSSIHELRRLARYLQTQNLNEWLGTCTVCPSWPSEEIRDFGVLYRGRFYFNLVQRTISWLRAFQSIEKNSEKNIPYIKSERSKTYISSMVSNPNKKHIIGITDTIAEIISRW